MFEQVVSLRALVVHQHIDPRFKGQIWLDTKPDVRDSSLGSRVNEREPSMCQLVSSYWQCTEILRPVESRCWWSDTVVSNGLYVFINMDEEVIEYHWWCPLHRHRNLSGWKTCHGSCKEILIWISNWTDGTILGDILTVMWWVYRPSRWKRAFESHPPPGRWSEVVWIHPEPYSPIGRKLVSQLRMCFKRALQLNRNSLRPCVVDTDDCPFKQTVWIRGRVRYIPI